MKKGEIIVSNLDEFKEVVGTSRLCGFKWRSGMNDQDVFDAVQGEFLSGNQAMIIAGEDCTLEFEIIPKKTDLSEFFSYVFSHREKEEGQLYEVILTHYITEYHHVIAKSVSDATLKAKQGCGDVIYATEGTPVVTDITEVRAKICPRCCSDDTKILGVDVDGSECFCMQCKLIWWE